MANKQSYLAMTVLFFTFISFPNSNGLRCYTCQWMDNRGDRECLDSPPPSRYLTECSQPQCWKKYSRYNGMTNVQRFCGAISGSRAYCQESSFENILRGEIYPATECFCNTEGCNGSSKLIGFNTFSNYGTIMTLFISSFVLMYSQRYVMVDKL